MLSGDPWLTIVQTHFRVYESRSEAMPGLGEARLYYLMFPQEELEQRYEAVREAILAVDRDLVVFMQHDGGEDVLVVAPRAPVAPQGTRANWILFALTIMTTVAAGAIYWQSYHHVEEPFRWSILWSGEHLAYGALTFALPLMAILGVHESAHFIAARRHGLRATLPYFIPFPPFALPIGTLGAFIRLKDPLPDRKALFDVGASGPIAGFIVAVPVLLLGAALTAEEGVVVPEIDVPEVAADVPLLITAQEPGRIVFALEGPATVTVTSAADGWSFSARIEAEHNGTLSDTWRGRLDEGEMARQHIGMPGPVNVTLTWDDNLIHFGNPLLVDILEWGGYENDDLLTHPTFFAGWVGLLITGINLLPAGQLDGGHVARAVFGDKMRYVAWGAIILLFYYAFQFQSWILMAMFIVFMGLNHPPPLNDRVRLDAKRMVLAGVTLVVFILTFVGRPIIL